MTSNRPSARLTARAARTRPRSTSCEPGKAAFTAESVLFFERRPVRSGKQSVTVVVDKPPTHAGVDPYNKRIDRNSDDNLTKVDVR